jgi:hypothetical protein
MRTAAIGGPGLPSGPARLRDARPARKRRGLSVDGATRRLELLFQLLVLATQPLAFRFRPAQVLAQPVDFSPLLVDDLLRIGRGRGLVALRHMAVMPNPRSKYKWKVRAKAY